MPHISAQRGGLVVLIGPDGAGKTTLARLVVSRLKGFAQEPSYVWCRFESKALGVILKALAGVRQHSFNSIDSYPSRKKDKERLMRNALFKHAFLAFVIVSYLIEIDNKIKRPLKRGTLVVSDRYFHDTVVDLWIDFGAENDELARLYAMFVRLAPKPDITFMLDVPEQISLARKNDIPSFDYISKRRQGYQGLSVISGGVQLNGTDPLEENAEKITRLIIHEMNRDGHGL